MDGFLTELSKPSWWISVVVAGVLVNMFSDYLKMFLEKIYSRYSQQANKKREKNIETFTKEVDSLNDPNKLLNAKTDLIYLAALLVFYSAFYLVGLVLITFLNPIKLDMLSLSFSITLTLWYFFGLTVKYRKALQLERMIRKFYENQGIKNNAYSIL